MSLFNLNKDVSGVSQKIRAAIKTKLVELGSCVEDELPDYIMCMVANKKTKDQMTDDLNLFLGDNAARFTAWLCELLNRLQSVSIEDKAVVKQEPVTQPVIQTYTPSSTIISNTAAAMQFPSPAIAESASIKRNDVISSTMHEQEDVLALKDEIEDDLFQEDAKQNGSREKPSKAPIKAPIVSQPNDSNNATKSAPRRKKMVLVRPASHKGPVSTVGAIVQRPIEQDLEYDVNKPAVGAVASIVKVSERKSSVPVSQQANKKLLMKAMQEAQLSVIKPNQPHKRSVKARLGPLKELTEPVDTEDVEMQCLDSDDVSEHVPDVNIITGDTSKLFNNQSSRIILKPTKLKTTAPDLNSNKHIMQSSGKAQLSPSFVITLDGVEEQALLNKSRKRTHNNVQMEDVEDDENEDPDYISDEEISTKRSKMPERCRFWPACKNADSCEYHHPNTNCKMFPKCKFGDKCLYIHPNCKFDAKCTKEDCPFTHSSRRNSKDLVSSTEMTTSEITCRFYPNCTKMDCPYKHPKFCRWGYSCKRPDCSFTHPELPTPDKLKWSAASKMESEAIESL